MNEFKLPDLGEGIHEGELLKWYVEVGDEIKEDDPLCDVETDKAAVTIPSPFTGRVSVLNGNIGDTLNVGDVIAVIGDGAAPAVETKKEVPESKPAEEAKVAEIKTHVPLKAPEKVEIKVDGPIAAAPATRKLAREMGIDIKQVPGTGPGGRITRDDVVNFSQGNLPQPVKSDEVIVPAEIESEIHEYTQSPIPYLEVVRLPNFEEYGPVEREPIRSIRRKVAFHTTSSMILVPHVAHMDEIDVTELEEFRQQQNRIRAESGDVKLTLMPFMVKTIASLLKKYPVFNSSLDPHRQEIVYKKYYNIGFAADTPRGLIVPVVHDADRKSIVEIGSEIYRLATKGREGTIEVNEMRNGTFSITNVGPVGGTGMVPTINYPESAILGMGRVQEKPVVRDGEIVIRKMLPVTLSFDHRVADGVQAATFVTELVSRLSNPNLLLLEN